MVRVSERRLRDDALAIWRAGVAAVDAGRLVGNAVHVDGGHLVAADAAGNVARYELDSVRRIAVVGAGKATASMAAALEIALGAQVLSSKAVGGLVNVPHATVRGLSCIRTHGARRLPDNRPTSMGEDGARSMMEIASSLGESDLLIVLLSGGGSALLPLPAPGISLEDKILVTTLLQERGATIDEMNCVRKHLSAIKGGQLAAATKARVLTLIVSDVVGDPLDVIASGPTAPDPTTFARAMIVVEKYGLLGHVSRAVFDRLAAGRDGAIDETPKHLRDRVTNVIVGNSDVARRAAAAAAESLGYEAIDVGDRTGDTHRDAAKLSVLPEACEEGGALHACVISGGETTVTLPAEHGLGGRNQEYALATLAVRGADRFAGFCVLCGGTDGEDGPTDAAGAFVDEELARDAERRGLDPKDFLRRHDAYHFFEPLGGLVKTGPTGTNVMDLRVVLIDRSE
jgi:glycerate 2-kinase